jgi:hypothetical protein
MQDAVLLCRIYPAIKPADPSQHMTEFSWNGSRPADVAFEVNCPPRGQEKTTPKYAYMQGRNSNYLRRQAEHCISLSRSTIDLAMAGRLRALAEELRRTAAQWDQETDSEPPHMVGGAHAPRG